MYEVCSHGRQRWLQSVLNPRLNGVNLIMVLLRDLVTIVVDDMGVEDLFP